MNLLTLRRQARKKSGVNVNDYANSDLDALINQAYYTMAGILANLEEDYFEEQNTKFTLQQNSSLYSLPTDCIAVKGLRLAYTTPTSESDYRIATSYDSSEVHDVAIDEVNTPTTNPIYDITNNFVRIYPRASAQVVNGGKIFYVAMPSGLVVTGDTPVLPTQYHDLLATYAAKEMAFSYEKWNKSDRLSNIWDKKIGELTEVLADRDRNRPMRMKSALEIGPIVYRRRREL